MADKEINDLTDGGAAVAGDLIHVVRSGNSRKVALNTGASIAIPFTPASSSAPASMEFAEDTDNGAHKVTLSAPSSLAADVAVELPSSPGVIRLNGRPGYRTISGADTVVASDLGKLIIATAGTFTLALTAVATLGQYFGCDVLNAGTGIVTLDANSTETINGATTQLLFPGDSAELVCTGGAWYAIIRRAAAIVTPWVDYTPTLTGFGTPSSVKFSSRRFASNLEIRGKFTAGTSTAVEARATMGFNGTSGNVASDASFVSTIQIAGPAVVSYAATTNIYVLIENNSTYLVFGAQTSGVGALSKINGSTMLGSGDTMSFVVSIPINGWN